MPHNKEYYDWWFVEKSASSGHLWSCIFSKLPNQCERCSTKWNIMRGSGTAWQIAHISYITLVLNHCKYLKCEIAERNAIQPLNSTVISFRFQTWQKKSSSAFKVCGSLPKAVTWQSGTESRAFIHLDSATPMMSVTDDCETLPSLSPHTQCRSPRAEVREGGGRGHNYQYKWSPANDVHCWVAWSSLQGNLSMLICFVDE